MGKKTAAAKKYFPKFKGKYIWIFFFLFQIYTFLPNFPFYSTNSAFSSSRTEKPKNLTLGAHQGHDTIWEPARIGNTERKQDSWFPGHCVGMGKDRICEQNIDQWNWHETYLKLFSFSTSRYIDFLPFSKSVSQSISQGYITVLTIRSLYVWSLMGTFLENWAKVVPIIGPLSSNIFFQPLESKISPAAHSAIMSNFSYY